MQPFYYIRKTTNNEFTLHHFCGGFNYDRGNLGDFDNAITNLIDLNLDGLNDDIKLKLIGDIEKNKNAQPNKVATLQQQSYYGEVSNHHKRLVKEATYSHAQSVLNAY